MSRNSMSDFISELETLGQLVRIAEEKRADELPALIDAVHDKAVLVEKIKDHDFPVLAGAYSNRTQYAHALGCDPRAVSARLGELAHRRIPPVVVDTAPCKDVIRKGDDVDLTRFPLFLHHPHDGHAYIQDVNVVSRHPAPGSSTGACTGSCTGPETRPTST